MLEPAHLKLTFQLLLLLATVPGCGSDLARFEYNQPKMGAGFRIVLFAKDQARADRAATAAFARVDQLNAILSDWKYAASSRKIATIARPRPNLSPFRVCCIGAI